MVSLYTRKSYFKKFVGRTLKNDLLPLTFEDFDATADCLRHGEGPDVLAELVKRHHFRRLQGAQKMYSTSPNWLYRRPFPRVDRYCRIPYGGSYEATRDRLAAFLDELVEARGITMLLFHPTYQGSLLEISTNSWEKRVWDTELFADPQIAAFFEGDPPPVETTTWREMTDRYAAGGPCD
jgi:hypothetical protein